MTSVFPVPNVLLKTLLLCIISNNLLETHLILAFRECFIRPPFGSAPCIELSDGANQIRQIILAFSILFRTEHNKIHVLIGELRMKNRYRPDPSPRTQISRLICETRFVVTRTPSVIPGFDLIIKMCRNIRIHGMQTTIRGTIPIVSFFWKIWCGFWKIYVSNQQTSDH